MKLHLPKPLFTALLAALTLATPATLSLGSTAWGAWGAGNEANTYYVTGAENESFTTADGTAQSAAANTLFVRVDNPGGTPTTQIATISSLTLADKESAYTLEISGHWSDSAKMFTDLTIDSLVSEATNATLKVSANNTVNVNALTGSLSNVTNAGNLTFGKVDNTANSFALGNITNSGMLTINGPVTLASASTLNLTEGSNLVLNNAGTIVLRNESNNTEYKKVTGIGTLTIGNGTVIDLANATRPGATGAIEGSVVVLGGGKLLLSGNSASLLGYNNVSSDTTATDNVYLRGSAGNVATMQITTTQNQHLSTNLYLQGYAQVTGGSGLIETYNGKITATGTNNYIDAKVQVNRDITVEVTGADDTLELRGYVYGGTMTKAGAGTLTFSNAGANKNSLSNYTHNSGITELKTEFSFTGALNLQGGDLSVYGNTTISGNITQTGGTLTIQQGGNLVLNATSFAGDISLLGSGTLTLAGAYNKTTDLSFTTGVTELVNFSQVGAGTLNLGTVNLTGSFLMMNYEGGAIHVTSLGTVAEGMELVYGKGSQLVNLGTFNQSLTLNFFDVADQLGTGVNLGLSLGGKTLEEAKALLSVNGLQGDYTLEDRGGSLYLTSTGTLTFSNGWDINWGGRGIAAAPALSEEHICTNVTSNRTVVNGSYYMIDESFENGEKVVIDLQDTTNSGKSIVGGFATQTDSNAQGSVNREVWIKATAGNYAFIVGGNFANNWDSGSAADFLGDTHILVDGASVTVGSVIGANHLDSQSPTFRGNTYISVMNGTITGDIIGSGSATHDVGTNKQVGDTHVFVYNNQTNDGYVTGGGIAGGFDGQNRNQRLTLEGDTHVTVDLSEQSGALEFAKNIVGAHVYKKTATPTLVHAGTTNITLIGNSDSNTRFNGLVIGGNYSAAGGTLTAGDVNMSIGASVHNIIVGGNYASNGSTMSVGDVNMSIGSYVDNNIIGGNYTVTSDAATTAQNIAIAVGQDGHVNGNLVGGHFVNGNGSAALSGGLGDVTITLAGGTIGVTYGGSWLKRNQSTANINQGNIHINLEGGNLNGNVYAAGYQEGSSKMTTASTKVSVDSDVAIASGVTISGGYRYAENKTGSTVSGSKTLVFNGESQDRSGITFDSFDTIQVTNKDTVVTLGTLSNFTDLTKTGAGTLTLSGTNTYTGTTSVQGGELILTSASPLGSGNISVAEGAALTLNTNSTIRLSAAERISGAGTVHIMNGTTLVMSHSSGTAAVKGSTIHVHGGGILNLDGNDRLGWGSNATGAILLKGESDTKLATLQLGGRQTMATSLLMQGNALVESTGGAGEDAGGLNPLKASGAQITATGKNNIINATLHRRDAFLFEVTGADDELEVQGNVVTQGGGISEGYDSSYEAGSIVKDGAGKLTFSGSGNTFDKKYLHKAGTSVMSGTASFTSTVEIQSGKFETSGTTTMSGAITNNGVVAVSGCSATLSGAVTNNGAITVSGGSATLSGAVTNNGAITVSGGTADFTGTLTMGTGSSLTVSDGSATVSGALNVTGTGVQIGQSDNGELNLTGSVSVAEGAAATLSGAITLGHTLTNNGSLTLNGTIYLAGDIDSSYEHREQGGTSYALAGGTDSTNEQNGFMKVEGASYYLTQSLDGVTNAVNTLGSNFATNAAGDKVVYHGTTSYEVDTDSKGLYFSTGDITGTQYYITTGDVVVDKAVQAAATGYTLQGGTMKLTAGSVNTSTITYTSGFITLSDGAELVLDGVPAGMTANSLLSGILSSTSAGNVKIARSGLDTYDGEGSGHADYSLNSAFAGTLELAAGVGFTLGNGNENSYSQDAVITLGNLSGMKLNDGSTLYYNASGVTTIKNLQVVDAASATIHFKDSRSDNAVQFAEKTQLDGDLTVSTTHDGGITFTNLVGDGSLTGSSGSGTFKTTISSLQYTEGDETSTFTGSLSFSGGSNDVAVSTGTETAISFVSLSATNVNSLSFDVETDTSIGTLVVATGAVDVSDGKTLALGAGTAEAQKQHSIGTLSAAAAGVTLGDHAALTLGAGSADAQKQHSIGTLSAAAAGVTLGDYATLTLGGGTADAQKQHSIGTLTGGTGSMLNLAENAVLNQLTSVPGPVTVTGSGTYIMGNTGYTNLTGWTDDTWTGTVVLDGMVLAGNADNKKLHEFGNAGSTVKLTDVTGWFWNTLASNGETFADAQSYGFALELVNGTNGYALKVTNGSSNSTTEFTGDISGTGDLHLDATSTVTGQVFTFSGDISNWKAITSGTESPEIKVINGKVYNIKLTGSADEVNVAFNRGDGTLNLTVETAATFNNTIDVNTLTLTQSATFNANTTASTMDAASSTVTLGENVTLALGAGTSSTQMQHSIGTLSAASAGVTLGDYATLTLGGGTAEAQKQHSIGTLTGGTGSMLNLAPHSVLNTITTASGVTLTGSGTYVLASGTMTMTSGVTLGADWTGAVRLSGGITNLDLAGSLYNNASWVEFAGVTGHLKKGTNTYGANIRLTDIGENAAITLNDGWTTNTHTFSGKIEGEGTWKRTSSGGTEQNYVFAGDVAGWTGAFVNAIPAKHSNDAATATNLTFQGASAINVDISNPGADAGNVGALNVTINDAAQGENKSAVAVNGSIQATKLTVDTAVSADFSNTVDVDTLVVNSGKTATFNNTATADTVELGEAATISGKQGAAATMSKVQMSSTGITGTAQDGSSIANADIEVLAQDASFTIEDMALSNVKLTAPNAIGPDGEIIPVVLRNVTAENTMLTGGEFTLHATPTPEVGSYDAETRTGTLSYSNGLGVSKGGSLMLNLDVINAVAPDKHGMYEITITLTGFGDTLEGLYEWDIMELVGFDPNSWLAETLNSGQDIEVASLEAEEDEDGDLDVPTVTYSPGTGENVGTLVITISGLNVPEPASATLGLAALMMLCARRRRKA